MSEKAVPQPQFGIVKAGAIDVALSPIPLPIVYFDNAPTLSHLNGVIGVTLTVTANAPNSVDETVVNCASVVAHLKCSIPAAHALISALQSALLLAQPVEKPEGKTN